MQRNWSTLKVAKSRKEFQLHQRLGGAVAKYEAQGLGSHRAFELAAADLGVDPQHAAAAINMRSTACLASEAADNEAESGAVLAAGEEPIEAALDRGRVLDLVAECMAGLDERETRIVTARFMSEKQVPLDGLGVEFGIIRERIRQIQNTATAKIRREPGRRGLALEDLISA